MAAVDSLSPPTETLEDVIVKSSWKKTDDPATLLNQEWLVTNGLGGYASGTVRGLSTRRYHGLFIPNLPSPRGRTVMIPRFHDALKIDDKIYPISGAQFQKDQFEADGASMLSDFRLVWSIPQWTYEINGRRLQKRITMPYGQSSVYLEYSLLDGDPVQLHARPYLSFRGHDGPLGGSPDWPFTLSLRKGFCEVTAFDGAPALRIAMRPHDGVFVADDKRNVETYYAVEKERGLDFEEKLTSPGYFSVMLEKGKPLSFVASTESWDSLTWDSPPIFEAELHRMQKLLLRAPELAQKGVPAQLVLAADQFIILPATRTHEKTMGDASGEYLRTVIAGYPWFTDWGRDTMISLEGLTLCTGRFQEARAILRTFSTYVKNGLLPNLFPEGEKTALYHTMDATLWFFHATDRYFQTTKDRDTLMTLYPIFKSIVDAHVKGTDFGIGIDPSDGLLRGGQEGYALTWMDAKVDNWVVTPRRGKPVEIQALWYNALRLMAEWAAELNQSPEDYKNRADQAFGSFNKKFWFTDGQYLFDVIEGPDGNNSQLRPNQIFSLSLKFPILLQAYWKPVVTAVTDHLLTPLGLRTLNSQNQSFHAHYEGDRWARDSAYHQGLVWAWLIGPYMDARKKIDPNPNMKLSFLKEFENHLKESGMGTINEIFDAVPPYTPRGCIAQAWSVAEVLRAYLS